MTCQFFDGMGTNVCRSVTVKKLAMNHVHGRMFLLGLQALNVLWDVQVGFMGFIEVCK